MRLQTFQCDICEGIVESDKIPVFGLKFHGSWPGEFTLTDPMNCDKQICLPCLQNFRRMPEVSE